MVIQLSCTDCDTTITLNVGYNEVFNANCPKCGCAKFGKIAFEEFVKEFDSEVKDNGCS